MQQVYEFRYVFLNLHLLILLISCFHVEAWKHNNVSCQRMVSQSSPPCAGSAPQIHMSMRCMLYDFADLKAILADTIPLSQAPTV